MAYTPWIIELTGLCGSIGSAMKYPLKIRKYGLASLKRNTTVEEEAISNNASAYPLSMSQTLAILTSYWRIGVSGLGTTTACANTLMQLMPPMNHRLNKLVRKVNKAAFSFTSLSNENYRVHNGSYIKKFDRDRRQYYSQCVSLPPSYIWNTSYAWWMLHNMEPEHRMHYSIRKFRKSANWHIKHEPSP